MTTRITDEEAIRLHIDWVRARTLAEHELARLIAQRVQDRLEGQPADMPSSAEAEIERELGGRVEEAARALLACRLANV